MKRRTIVHVTTVPMSLTFLQSLIPALQARDMNVEVVSAPGEDASHFAAKFGIRVHTVAMTRRISPLQDLAALMAMVKILRQIRPAIVHAHTPKGGLLGMLAASFARVPVRIYHLRGLPLDGAVGMKRKLLHATELVSCTLAQTVICVAESLRNSALELRLAPPEKLEVLGAGSGQGVDAEARFNPKLVAARRTHARERYSIPESCRVVGFVGRIVRDKGVVELEAAWTILRLRYPNLMLLLVGPEESQDPVPAGVMNRLRCDDRVRLIGMEWDTPPLYALMDVVVLPSYREGFHNVPLEAAAMERPVVATQISGCMEAVEDGVTGTLVAPRDSSALVDAISMYIADSEMRDLHGRAGRARVLNQFRPDTIADATVALYEAMLRRRGIPAP